MYFFIFRMTVKLGRGAERCRTMKNAPGAHDHFSTWDEIYSLRGEEETGRLWGIFRLDAKTLTVLLAFGKTPRHLDGWWKWHSGWPSGYAACADHTANLCWPLLGCCAPAPWNTDKRNKTSLTNHFINKLLYTRDLCWGVNTTSECYKKLCTHSSSILVSPKKAPSMSLVILFLCIFSIFRESIPLNVRLSTILILFRFNSLEYSAKNIFMMCTDLSTNY